MRLQPFAALRPTPDKAAQVASVPYDVVNRAEAAELAKGNPAQLPARGARRDRRSAPTSARTTPRSTPKRSRTWRVCSRTACWSARKRRACTSTAW